MGQPMMLPPAPPRGPWQRRAMNAAAKAIFPQWLSRNALIVYFLALAVVTFMYSAYSLPWYFMLSGVVAVGVFFLYGGTAIKDTSLDKIRKESRFEKRIFLIAFIPRVIWMFLIYTIFMQTYGDAFGFENGDATYYDTLGQFVAGLIKNGTFIFTIPFPSMVRPWDGQDVQQLLNGGNFVKNILSGFTIFAMVMLLISGKWREHLLPLSFLLGYLVVLTMSTFAQSERFHQPAMPFEFMFAAYGLSIAITQKKYKRWFMYWCAFMFVAAIVWNWFKLAGRGLA